MEQISEVHFYQGVKFGGSVIRFVALDSSFSDARLKRGNMASIKEGIGVQIANAESKERIVVPFNNVAFIRYLDSAEVKDTKKSK